MMPLPRPSSCDSHMALFFCLRVCVCDFVNTRLDSERPHLGVFKSSSLGCGNGESLRGKMRVTAFQIHAHSVSL